MAAILDDPGYETADAETRLVDRLRLADDVVLLAGMEGRKVTVGDQEAADAVNIHSDEPFIRSLGRLGFVSLPPGMAASG